jgi:hypothetical protein
VDATILAGDVAAGDRTVADVEEDRGGQQGY